MSITSAKTGATGISLALENNFMEPIASTVVGSGGASAIIFNDIPQTYKHLQIRGISNSSNASYIAAQFNGDIGTSYSNHAIYAEPGTVVGQANTSTTNVQIARSNYVAGSMYGAGICDILDYANTNKYKSTRALAGNDSNGTAGGVVFFSSGSWRSFAAITSITIFPTSPSFSQYSRFSLYGIKG